MSSKKRYAPPAGPPPKRALLNPSTVLAYPIDLDQLADQGWATLPLQDSPQDPLYTAFTELFLASAQFFNLAEEERMGYRVEASKGAQSEEGYSRVEGEKCMITLRKVRTTPKEFGLCDKAEAVWRASARVMRDVLVVIEESLGMKPGALVRIAEAQLELPREGSANVATLMRMFRYDRPYSPSAPGVGTNENENAVANLESKVVAEAHKDLGLLTIVAGHSPGLECWDAERGAWVSCEGKEGMNVTILVGQTLAKFTNARYVAGRHRVFVHPSPSPSPSPGSSSIQRNFVSIIGSESGGLASPSSKKESESESETLLYDPSYRFSLVHALRGHFPVRVSYSDFETPITGAYAPAFRFLKASILDIYTAISNASWNVNISVEERRRQEKALLEKEERERRSKSISADPDEYFEGREKGKRGYRFSRILPVFRRSERQTMHMNSLSL